MMFYQISIGLNAAYFNNCRKTNYACLHSQFNDTHREKLCFTESSIRSAAWLLLTFCICLHNKLSSVHSITRMKQYRCLKNVIHQIDSKNE